MQKLRYGNRTLPPYLSIDTKWSYGISPARAFVIAGRGLAPPDDRGTALLMEPGAAYASRYVDPLKDFGFKHLFGKETHKDIPIDFLNELFKGQKVITDVHFHTTEQSGPVKDIRKVILDVLCTDDQGNYFVIEMQRASQEYFTNRIDYYASRLISDQLSPGDASRKFPLKEVNMVGLLNFCLPDTPPDVYLHTIRQMCMETGKWFPSPRTFKFIELTKFHKTENELMTGLDQWLYLLRNLKHLRHQPPCLNKPIFERVFKIAEIANLTKEDLHMFCLQTPLQDQYDYEHVMEYGKRMAKEEGHKEGRTEGQREGRKEGRKEGRREGRRAKAIEIARKLKEMGLSIAAIAEATGLQTEEVRTC